MFSLGHDRCDGGLVMMSAYFAVLIAVNLALYFLRRRRGVLRPGESALVFGPLAYSLAIWVMTLVGDKTVVTFWRYHYPAYALLLVLPARQIASLCRKGVLAKVLFAACVLGIFVGTAARQVRHFSDVGRYHTARIHAVLRQAAAVIRADWNGPAYGVRRYSPTEYASPRRPFVFACHPYVAYLAGGSPSPLEVDLSFAPDYFLVADRPDWSRIPFLLYGACACELVREFQVGRSGFRLYRRKDDCR